MQGPWIHIGRLWTNGEPFLAVDAALRHAWHGFSNDDLDRVIELFPHDTSITVGSGRAVLVGADGEVRDDGWVEVFAAAGGLVALVQAAARITPDVLARALRYPEAGDKDGGALNVSSSEIAIFSASADGAGPYSVPLLPAQPGPAPPVPGPPSHKVDPGLLLSAVHTGYKVKVRWYTELGKDSCFARSFQRRPTTERGTRPAADADVHRQAGDA